MIPSQDHRTRLLQRQTTLNYLRRVRAVADDITQDRMMGYAARVCIGQAGLKRWQVSMQIRQ